MLDVKAEVTWNSWPPKIYQDQDSSPERRRSNHACSTAQLYQCCTNGRPRLPGQRSATGSCAHMYTHMQVCRGPLPQNVVTSQCALTEGTEGPSGRHRPWAAIHMMTPTCCAVHCSIPAWPQAGCLPRYLHIPVSWLSTDQTHASRDEHGRK